MAGVLERTVENGGSGRIMVDFASIRPHICISLEEDIKLIRDADAGQAEAQDDLALLFLENDKPRSAIYWLELAAKQDYAEAMHWLGRCYIDGNGVVKDENKGIMWIAKSAGAGHNISQTQMQAMRDKFTGQE